VGKVGYKFKILFQAYKKSYDGEVIDIFGNSMRRCWFIDGIEHYTERYETKVQNKDVVMTLPIR